MATEQTNTQQTQAPKVEVTEAVVRLRQSLNERLAGQAARGQAPWQQKLDPAKGERLPYNPLSKSGLPMQGVNGLVLASIAQEKGFDDPRWVTKQQMEARGWGPVKGQSPASVEFYADTYQRQVRDARGNPVFDQKGEAVREEVKHDVPKVFAVNMYNMAQIRELQYAKEKIPQLEVVTRSPDTKGVDRLLAASGIEMAADGGNYFTKTQDGRGVVHVPKEPGLAQSQAVLRGVAEKTVFLDGPAGARRDDSPQMRYAKQQLRVDLATRIMSDKLGLPTDPSKTDPFKDKYAEIISNNKDEIRYAAHDANRAVERMVKGDFTPSRGQQQQQQQQQAERKQPEQQQQAKAAPAKAKPKDKGIDR